MRAFFDTNVLVYLFDGASPDKQQTARALLQREADTGRVLLSTQVLQEFFVASTRKHAVPLGIEQVERAVRDLARFSLVQIDAPLIIGAIELSRRLNFSFWDALIVKAALQGGASLLYTEDLQDGQVIDGMAIANPVRHGAAGGPAIN